MALSTGLVPVFGFVLTVGLATPVTVGAHLFYRTGDGEFSSALKAALVEAGGLYLVGVVAVWSIAGGPALWEVAATLLVAGFVALIALAVLPLSLGRRLVRREGAVDSENALRYATYGWPVAMLVAFGLFVAPGGLTRGHLLGLGGEGICLAGHCGIPHWFAVAVLVELVVVLLGPGVVGLVIYSSSATAGGRGASS